ncbi:alkyl hydroperoxide reductase/ Thiol specific antioxidant/ Mal allergen [Mycobacteroides abscessus subsp. massiliense]|nr:alkyl hydroperoxide reductase/ Thiol specific antioxidant/ Mal allergen [Mycobacteroides abscessus subsp. massiliense]
MTTTTDSPSTARPGRRTMVRRLLAVAVAAAAALAAATLAACGPASTTSPAPTTSTHPSGPSGNSAASANPVSLTTIDGKQVSVPGPVPTALFFFSVGCGECVGGGKSFAQATAQTAPRKAAFLAVDMDPGDSPEAITGFLQQIGAQNLPAVIDRGATLSRTYQVSALSTLIVVDPAGKVTYRGTDPSADKIVAAVADAK